MVTYVAKCVYNSLTVIIVAKHEGQTCLGVESIFSSARALRIGGCAFNTQAKPPNLTALKKFEMSLGTPDRAEAEVEAADWIKGHKLLLLAARQHRDGTLKGWQQPEFTPFKEHFLPDGSRVFATESELHHLDGIPRTEPNERLLMMHLQPTAEEAEAIKPFLKNPKRTDDEIIDTWIRHRSISKHIEAEARKAWHLFRQITNNRPLKHCTRDDGRKLVEALKTSGNKRQTILKKVSHLRAAVNLAIREGKLAFNPFSDIVPKAKDGIRRHPLDEDDMALVKAHLDELRTDDRLLWYWLATTGMRLEEPFQITEENREGAHRYVVIGRKTETSKRRIPIPDILLPHLPSKIEAPLFTGTHRAAGKRILRLLRRLAISHDAKRGTGNPRKVIHSLRHRAADRLRAARCPIEIQHQLLGHEVKTVASGYGHGYPVAELKEWVEKIGC
jgi:site-specific recombinase XerC